MRNIPVTNSTKPNNMEATMSWAVINSSFPKMMGVQIFRTIYPFSPGT